MKNENENSQVEETRSAAKVFVKDENKKFYVAKLTTNEVFCITKGQIEREDLFIGHSPENELQFTIKEVYDRYISTGSIQFTYQKPDPKTNIMSTYPINYIVPSNSSYKLPKTRILKGKQKSTQSITRKITKVVEYLNKKGNLARKYTYEKLKTSATIVHAK